MNTKRTTQRSNRLRVVGAVAALLFVAAACGDGDGDADAVGSGEAASARVIEISMTEMAFAPDDLTVQAGEEITFRFSNDGAIIHEAVIGNAAEQANHATSRDSGLSEISLEAGEVGDLSVRFDEPGEYEIVCHEPGHAESGMRATVTVT